jgi:hypothetical protein
MHPVAAECIRGVWKWIELPELMELMEPEVNTKYQR